MQLTASGDGTTDWFLLVITIHREKITGLKVTDLVNAKDGVNEKKHLFSWHLIVLKIRVLP
jgi:hypothetical protein